MSFLRKAWYFAEWSDRFDGDAPIGLTIAGEQIALYRKQSGGFAAVGDRCPHRFAPLHMGKVRGDAIECPYHGLQFGSDGHCVHSPHHSGAVPHSVKVASYPAVERDGAIWIWLSDEPADLDRIPDLSDLQGFSSNVGNEWRMPVRAHYELLVDNILDGTHADFVHPGTLGNGEFSKRKPVVSEHGDAVTVEWICDGVLAHPSLMDYVTDWAEVDSWLSVRWQAPAVLRLEIGAKQAGNDRASGVRAVAYHIMVPQDDLHTSYHVRGIRNYALNDTVMSERIQAFVEFAFSEQDKPVIEAQQRMMGGEDFWTLRPLLLPSDTAAVQVRRKLISLIERQHQAA